MFNAAARIAHCQRRERIHLQLKHRARIVPVSALTGAWVKRAYLKRPIAPGIAGADRLDRYATTSRRRKERAKSRRVDRSCGHHEAVRRRGGKYVAYAADVIAVGVSDDQPRQPFYPAHTQLLQQVLSRSARVSWSGVHEHGVLRIREQHSLSLPHIDDVE